MKEKEKESAYCYERDVRAHTWSSVWAASWDTADSEQMK